MMMTTVIPKHRLAQKVSQSHPYNSGKGDEKHLSETYERPLSDCEDDLVLFHDIYNAESSSFFDSYPDEHDDSLSRRLSAFTDSSTHTPKSDFDWLVTPPDTPHSSMQDQKNVFHRASHKAKQCSAGFAEGKTPEKSPRVNSRPASLHRNAKSWNPKTNSLITDSKYRTYSTETTNTSSSTEQLSNSNRPYAPGRRSSTPPAKLSSTKTHNSSSVQKELSHVTQHSSPRKLRHGSSFSKVQAWQSSIPGISFEAPLNLRRTMPSQSKFHSRGISPSSGHTEGSRVKTKRQSVSPGVSRQVKSSNSNESGRYSKSLNSNVSSKNTTSMKSTYQEASPQKKEPTLKSGSLSASNKQIKHKLASNSKGIGPSAHQLKHSPNSTSMFRPLLLDAPPVSTQSLSFQSLAGDGNSYDNTSINAQNKEGCHVASDSENNQKVNRKSFSFNHRNEMRSIQEESCQSQKVSEEYCECPDRGLMSNAVDSNTDHDQQYSSKIVSEVCETDNNRCRLHKHSFDVEVVADDISIASSSDEHGEFEKERKECFKSENGNDKYDDTHTLDIQSYDYEKCTHLSVTGDNFLESLEQDHLRKFELETMQRHDTWLRHTSSLAGLETYLKETDFSVDFHNTPQDQLDSDRMPEGNSPFHIPPKEIELAGYERYQNMTMPLLGLNCQSDVNTSKEKFLNLSDEFPKPFVRESSHKRNASVDMVFKMDNRNPRTLCRSYSQVRSRETHTLRGTLSEFTSHLEKLADYKLDILDMKSDLNVTHSETHSRQHQISACNDFDDSEGYFEFSPETNEIRSIAKTQCENAFLRDANLEICGREPQSPESRHISITKEFDEMSEDASESNDDIGIEISIQDGDRVDTALFDSNQMDPEHSFSNGGSHRMQELGKPSANDGPKASNEMKVDLDGFPREENAGSQRDRSSLLRKYQSMQADRRPTSLTIKGFKQQHNHFAQRKQSAEGDDPLQTDGFQGTRVLQPRKTNLSSESKREEVKDTFLFCKSLVEDIAETAMHTPTKQVAALSPVLVSPAPELESESGYLTAASEEPLIPLRKAPRQGFNSCQRSASQRISTVLAEREKETVALRVVTVPQRDAIEHERRERRKRCCCRCNIM